MGSWQGREIGRECGPLRGELRLADHATLAIHRLNRDRSFVQIDAGKQHTPSETKTSIPMISSLGLAGNNNALLLAPHTLCCLPPCGFAMAVPVDIRRSGTRGR